MGNVIEKANNSAGIYSLAQGLPPIEPAVERRLQYAEAETEVVLNCPGYKKFIYQISSINKSAFKKLKFESTN